MAEFLIGATPYQYLQALARYHRLHQAYGPC